MRNLARRIGDGLVPAGWLVVDAAIAAAVAAPAQVLLLYLLSPEIPLVLDEFVATMVALAPQIVVVFVLAGPALVLLGMALSVGRSRRRGVSVRYVARFALLDAGLLALASAYQWHALGDLLPERAQLCLALTASSLVLAFVFALVLVVIDVRRPGALSAPWLVALGVALIIALSLTAAIRRVRFDPPQAVVAPGFVATRPIVLIEIPGLQSGDLERYVERGQAVSLEALAERGATMPVTAGPLADSMGLHATLVTGREPRHHGILASVRYRALGQDRSFSTLPRGLFLRPLLATSLWERTPVDANAARVVGLPGIAASLGVSLARIGDPLAWPTSSPDELVVTRDRLAPGRVHDVARERIACPQPTDVEARFFDPPASELASTARLAALVESALAADVCALRLARAASASGRWPIVHVRLEGHDRVAYHFAGWREDRPARGVPEREIQAYGRTLTRYVREIDPELEVLLAAVPPEALVVVVSPHGIEPRQDFERLLHELVGRTTPTGTHAGPPPGIAIMAGEGIDAARGPARPMSLRSVLPTLLWASGLPAAQDMGPIELARFTSEYVRSHPVVAIPSYTRNPPPG
jgi:hypothetical protein